MLSLLEVNPNFPYFQFAPGHGNPRGRFPPVRTQLLTPDAPHDTTQHKRQNTRLLETPSQLTADLPTPLTDLRVYHLSGVNLWVSACMGAWLGSHVKLKVYVSCSGVGGSIQLEVFGQALGTCISLLGLMFIMHVSHLYICNSSAHVLQPSSGHSGDLRQGLWGS